MERACRIWFAGYLTMSLRSDQLIILAERARKRLKKGELVVRRVKKWFRTYGKKGKYRCTLSRLFRSGRYQGHE